MADNRKYYYLKLKESYFDDDSIILLESMQDGILYSYILLKLYLKSLKHDGKLQLDDHIPYNAQMIATITRQQVGTIERALQIYEKLGLVEILEDSTFYMSNIELFIGKSSTEGERKRRARNGNIKQKQLGGQMSTPILDKCPPEIEREKEIEIELEKERELEKGHHTQIYGKYQNISLTDEELERLKQELPSLYQKYIEKLSEYMASTGKTYNSHIATIRKWAKEDMEKNANIKNAPRTYEYDENKSL
ncbi:phage replisome organizer N-terminal domain-containing protein [Tannockella kyphosi]|uniref:phage replisome organizer N-terminal domain-containing protein n=1 Tax=Tannockella kyphosi TaxID=2899121 RepID=UPI002013BD69|nr:phage replisome organizer N-terminal domain-containing protein [Tannockella kyphosi]